MPVVGAGCPERFDTAAWRAAEPLSDERHDLAEQVVECGFVERGDNDRHVARVLGYPGSPKRSWVRMRYWDYDVGETNGTLGPPDAQSLYVEFDPRRRVRVVELTPP